MEYLVRGDVAPVVHIIFLGLLLLYYFGYSVSNNKYVPKFDIIIGLMFSIITIPLYFLLIDTYSRVSGLETLAYLSYWIVIWIFLICLLFINLIVFFIKSQMK
jgi:hypothetical protein